METFIGSFSDLRDKIGVHLTNHVRELNKTCTTNDIARLHDLTIGIVSNINTGNHQRISFSAILEAAAKLGFVYNLSISNKNDVSKISYSITLSKNII